MGIDYENINRYENYEYESFIPSFFSSKIKKANQNSNNKLEVKNKKYSKLDNNSSKNIEQFSKTNSIKAQ
jgi:hypothetical protein